MARSRRQVRATRVQGVHTMPCHSLARMGESEAGSEVDLIKRPFEVPALMIVRGSERRSK